MDTTVKVSHTIRVYTLMVYMYSVGHCVHTTSTYYECQFTKLADGWEKPHLSIAERQSPFSYQIILYEKLFGQSLTAVDDGVIRHRPLLLLSTYNQLTWPCWCVYDCVQSVLVVLSPLATVTGCVIATQRSRPASVIRGGVGRTAIIVMWGSMETQALIHARSVREGPTTRVIGTGIQSSHLISHHRCNCCGAVQLVFN